MTNADTDWIKSAKSANSGECVELRRHDGAIQIRDSKDPQGAVLSFTAGELDAWIDGAKKNEFDRLLQLAPPEPRSSGRGWSVVQ